jgi:hypothetical protein
MHNLDIAQLTQNCHADQLARRPNSECCRELFYRALAQNDQDAWNAIYQEFSFMALGWVYTYSRFEETGEEAFYFVNDAFARLNRFGSRHAQAGTFEKLSGYLQFLKECIWASIESHLRKLKKDALWAAIHVDETEDGSEEFSLVLPDASSDKSEFIENLFQALHETTQSNEQERLVAEETWIYGLPPRDIQAKYPDLFRTAGDVNQIKHNILKRLKRHPRLRESGGQP